MANRVLTLQASREAEIHDTDLLPLGEGMRPEGDSSETTRGTGGKQSEIQARGGAGVAGRAASRGDTSEGNS